MNYARVYHTLTMLADGRVLAVGGEATSDQTQVTTGVLPAEIWDPATGQWTVGRVDVGGAQLPLDRRPDAGRHGAGRRRRTRGQRHGPGPVLGSGLLAVYLFDGPRPTITSAPASSTYGATMTVSTPDASSISAVNLVSLGADTHQADMDQHFVPLSFTAGIGLADRAGTGLGGAGAAGLLHAVHRQRARRSVRGRDRADRSDATDGARRPDRGGRLAPVTARRR